MTPGQVSSSVLQTTELFLETNPDFETATLQFAPHQVGENNSVRMMQVTIDGDRYLVVCKRVGGPV